MQENCLPGFERENESLRDYNGLDAMRCDALKTMNSKPLLNIFYFINTVEEAIWTQTVNFNEKETIPDVRSQTKKRISKTTIA